MAHVFMASNAEYENPYYKTSENEINIKSEQKANDSEKSGYKGTPKRRQYLSFYRILRFLTIAAVVISTIYVSSKASMRYIDNWVQTVIERTDVHIGEIPFPRVVVYEPNVEPDFQAKFLNGKRTVVRVNPTRFTSDPEIATIHPTLRHCYFTSEMQEMGLSESACRQKCRLRYVLNKCNCTLGSAANINSATNALKNTTEICSPANVGCLNDLEDYINYYESTNHYEEALYRSGLNCSCFHNCNYIQYNTAVYTDSAGTDLISNYTELQVFYQHSTFFSYRSTLVATCVDLLGE